MRLHAAVLAACLLASGCGGLADSSGDAGNNHEGMGGEKRIPVFNLPDFYQHPRKYKVDPYLDAAVTIQAAGKERGEKLLLDLARQDPAFNTIILCRMLFTAKARGEFRSPLIGTPGFLGKTKVADWPLHPIELVDEVPFLIVWGHRLGGKPEQPTSYVDYCIRECDRRETKYKPHTDAEKQKALEKLMSSRKWKAELKDYEREFLESQIK